MERLFGGEERQGQKRKPKAVRTGMARDGTGDIGSPDRRPAILELIPTPEKRSKNSWLLDRLLERES